MCIGKSHILGIAKGNPTKMYREMEQRQRYTNTPKDISKGGASSEEVQATARRRERVSADLQTNGTSTQALPCISCQALK